MTSEANRPAPLPPAPVELEPLTFSLLGRFFGIPLLIIGLIVGGAVMVVLLFGAPSAHEKRSLETLLSALETGAGQRSMGSMLLPADKEYWQAGLELAERLKTDTFTDAELTDAASRLSTIVRDDLAATKGRDADVGFGQPSRLEFVIRALGRTRQPEAITTLIQVVESNQEPYVTAAIEELANLHEHPNSAAAIGPILAVMQSGGRAESKLAGSTALSVLAEPGDERVIAALEVLRRGHEGEVEWNAALALARLGSAEGKLTLLDMLSRDYWSTKARFQARDPESGRVVSEHPMPPQRIDSILVATIEAVQSLRDADLWERIDQLQSDPSPKVRSAASEAMQVRMAASGGA